MSGASYFPYHRQESYPAGLTVDFKRIKQSTLKRYIQQHDLNVRPDSTPLELSVAVARHFHSRLSIPSEQEVIKTFVSCVSGNETVDAAGRQEPNEKTQKVSKKRKRTSSKTTKEVAQGQCLPGTEVAAKVRDTWIHARIVEFHQRTKKYEVEDADTETNGDKTDVYHVAPKHVIPLVVRRNPSQNFTKGTRVLALFPYTTSFYAGEIVSSGPKHEAGGRYGVKFDDDKEEGKVVKMRKIPRYFVVKHPTQ